MRKRMTDHAAPWQGLESIEPRLLLSAAVNVPFGPVDAGGLGGADVAVVMADRASFSSPVRHFAAVPAPVVTSITPNAGSLAGGTTVTIKGTNLLGTTSVQFGARVGIIVSVTDTQIVINSPVGKVSTVDVRVVAGGRASAISPADRFAYVLPPKITSLSAKAGPLAGGTRVTIKGLNLLGASEVYFGTASADIQSNTATQIVVNSPAGAEGVAAVTVVTPGGTSVISTADRFSYVAAPTVTGISPAAGPTAGRTRVTITGTNLSNAAAVNFGTASAVIVRRSATQVVVNSPAGAAGIVDVTVATAGGKSSILPPPPAVLPVDQFTYVPAPTITSLDVTSGPVVGGTVVTITGTNLSGATAVDFGSKAGAIVSNNGTEIVVTTPAGRAGSVKVKVVTSGGPSAISSNTQFVYVVAPTVRSVSPKAGAREGGATVIITGANLLNASAVNFGSQAGAIVSNTATQIVVTSPAGAAGTVDVKVVTAGGTSSASSADQFAYVIAPVVASVAPSAGPLQGGTTVTITGTNLLGAAAVNFGSAPGTIVSDTDTQIVATSPAGSAGVVDITVTTAGGTSATSSDDQFTYSAG